MIMMILMILIISIILILVGMMLVSPAKTIMVNDPNIAFATTRLDQRPSVRPRWWSWLLSSFWFLLFSFDLWQFSHVTTRRLDHSPSVRPIIVTILTIILMLFSIFPQAKIRPTAPVVSFDDHCLIHSCDDNFDHIRVLRVTVPSKGSPT